MKQVASLQYDVMFKKAFSDPEIFTAFARDFLNIDLEIDHVETEKTFDPPIGRVKLKFDLYAEDAKHRTIVDIQHERYPDHYHRFLHYQCAALLEQVLNSYDYCPPLNVFTLVVLTSPDKYQTDLSVIDFDPHTLQGRALGEIPHKVVYICPRHVTDQTPEPYRQWMLAINDSLDEEVEESVYTRAEIRKIFDYIEKDLITPEERARMFDEYGQEAVQQEKFMHAIEQVAQNMLTAGTFSCEQIARLTGLSIERVKELAGA